MNGKLKCPKCNSDHLIIERRPNGKITCGDCHYRGSYTYFMNHPDRPFTRSELFCTEDGKCRVLALSLATNLCYMDLLEHFKKFKKSRVYIDKVDEFLQTNGYSKHDLKMSYNNPWTVRQVLDTFKDVNVVICTKKNSVGTPTLHYYQNKVLYTTYKNDEVFEKKVYKIWIRS
jgi:hypothetical protein